MEYGISRLWVSHKLIERPTPSFVNALVLMHVELMLSWDRPLRLSVKIDRFSVFLFLTTCRKESLGVQLETLSLLFYWIS